MQIIPKIVRLSELGQVWGDPEAFDTFKASISSGAPQRWETLCSWFQNATGDRGYILEVPSGVDLDALLGGETKLFGLTIIFGAPEAVEAQIEHGPEAYLLGGILMDFSQGPQFSVHT